MNGTVAVFAPAHRQPMCRTFRGEPNQIPLVRDFVKRHLVERHDCPDSVLDDILLCATEIATNAIQHTSSGSGGQFTVLLHANSSAARVEVIDDGPRPWPDKGHYDAVEDGDVLPQGGLGLRLVSAHSDRMGYEERGQRGVAWFERTWDGCVPRPDVVTGSFHRSRPRRRRGDRLVGMNVLPSSLDLRRPLRAVMEAGAAFLPQALDEAFRQRLRWEVEAESFETLTEQVGPYGVRQDGEVLAVRGDLDAYPALGELRDELIHRLRDQGTDIEGLDRWRPNDVSVQRYSSDSRGISPHRDGRRHSYLVAVFTTCGSAPFALCREIGRAHV